MLKWLKQKPVNGDNEIGSEIITNTTDDPLAAFQVTQVSAKVIGKNSVKRKSSSSNEVYAVSRVNPLFEEDETVKGPISPGNSGSSGYDSNQSDEETPQNSKNLKSSLNHETKNEKAKTSPPPPPLPNLISQNPNFVKKIAVGNEVPDSTGLSLSPLIEPNREKLKKVSAINVPIRNLEPSKPGDSIGAAKLLQRSSNYVQSIRIVPSTSKNHQIQRDSSFKNKINAQKELQRKPSVTFSDKIDVLDSKLDLEGDSIVTDSLLHLTSGSSQILGSKNGQKSIVKAQIHSHQQNNSQISQAKNSFNKENNLRTFSDSLSKNRMVRQIVSNRTSSASPVERIESPDENEDKNEILERVRRGRTFSNGPKSPFGGIADHYAAAKEIAKEIDSYSSGTTKSTKISLVKDLLLSGRNRHATPSSSSSSASSSPASPWNIYGQSDETSLIRHTNTTVLQTIVQLNPVSKSPKNNETSSFISSPHRPQVYVKDDLSRKNNEKTTNLVSQSSKNGEKSQQSSDHHENEGQDQVPIYDALPGATHLHPQSHDDSDSGNSTDRNQKDEPVSSSPSSVPEISPPPKTQPSPPPEPNKKIPPSPPSASSSSSSSSNNEKVMIISGHSQNMVVDLSAVPTDLRNAIISGTALVTLPQGHLNQNLRDLEGGFTVVSLPTDENEYEIIDPMRRYGAKNLTESWGQVLEASTLGKGYKNKKRITTVLPYHPNQDAHTTADFTIEGQPLARQTRKVKKLKTRRCLCRIFGIIIFLVAFLGVIVMLSLYYTKGKHYFGSV